MKGRKNHEQQNSFYGIVCNADWFLVMDLLVHMGVILNKDEALRLALEVLADLGMKHYENTGEVLYKNTYTAIKAALEAKDEPAAWMNKYGACKTSLFRDVEAGAKEEYTIPLYTTPPQRTWVGLTDEEANQLWESTDSDWELMKRTEAKLKEKNT